MFAVLEEVTINWHPTDRLDGFPKVTLTKVNPVPGANMASTAGLCKTVLFIPANVVVAKPNKNMDIKTIKNIFLFIFIPPLYFNTNKLPILFLPYLPTITYAITICRMQFAIWLYTNIFFSCMCYKHNFYHIQ